MSSPTDDKDLDEYLTGRSEVSRRYRSAAGEEPPAELDRAVLAQARAAAESSPSKVARFPRRRQARWMVPFAVAATMVLTFAIFREMKTDMDFAPQELTVPVMTPAKTERLEEREAGSTSAISEGTATSQVQPARALQDSAALVQNEERRSYEILKKMELKTVGSRAVAITTPVSSPLPAEMPESASTAPASPPPTDATQPVKTQSAPPPLPAVTFSGSHAKYLNAPIAAGARGRTSDKVAPEPRTPETWLEDIRKLRASEKQTEAQAQLQRFLEAYPDYFEKNPGVVRP